MEPKCKDLDKRIDEILEELKERGKEISQDELLNLKLEVENDFEQVKDYCDYTYIQKVQLALLLLDKLLR